MWQIHAYLYDVIIARDTHDCVPTLTVCAFHYDIFYDLILKVSINKNLLILSVANSTAQSHQHQCAKAMFSILWFRQEEQNSEFLKNFFRGISFCIC